MFAPNVRKTLFIFSCVVMFAGEKINSGPLTNQRNFGTWLVSQKCCDIFIQSSIGSNFSSLIVLKMKPDLYSFISGGLESAEAHAFTGLKKNKKLATWMPYFWFLSLLRSGSRSQNYEVEWRWTNFFGRQWAKMKLSRWLFFRMRTVLTLACLLWGPYPPSPMELEPR